jgi:hypothetical protein
MTTEELFALLESQAVFPLLVEEEGSHLRRPGLTMLSDLGRFTKAVQSLGEKVVFISARRLQEADFLHESAVKDDGSGEGDFGPPQLISLGTACPEIEGFKPRLNQECAFTLSVYFKQTALHYCLAEAWWLEFQALRERAITALEERARTRREQLEAERERELERQRVRQQSLVEKLRGLLKNRDFLEIASRKDATLRGMQAAALEMIPVLRELGPDVFKAEIQALSDRLKAQKALQKR